MSIYNQNAKDKDFKNPFPKSASLLSKLFSHLFKKSPIWTDQSYGVMIGGKHFPASTLMSDEELIEEAEQFIETYYGVPNADEHSKVIVKRLNHCIP